MNMYRGINVIPDTVGSQETLFTKLIRWIMFSVLAIYPFGMAVPVLWNKINGVLWIDEERLVWLLVAMPLLALLLLWRLIPQQMSNKKALATCVLLFGTSVVIRLLACAVLQVQPLSDFNTCYEYAAAVSQSDEFILFYNQELAQYSFLDNNSNSYLAQFPYLGAYALTLCWFFKYVGASVFSAQLLSAIVTSAIPGLLFLAVRRVTGKSNVGLVAGVSYLVYPSMIVYGTVPSCEHFSQFFFAVFICFLAYFFTEPLNNIKKWLYTVGAGISLAGLCVYKELLIVIAPAFLMVSFCYEITPIISNAIKHKQIDYQKLIFILLLDVLVVLLAFYLHRQLVQVVQITILGVPVHRESLFAATLYEGLCKTGGGQWNPDVKNYVYNVLQTSESPSEASRILYMALYEEYKGDFPALWNTIYNKFLIDWCDEAVYYYWTFSDTNIIQGYWIGEVLFYFVPNAWSLIVVSVTSLGCVISLFSRESTRERYFDFFVSGVTFLFAIALILMEAQGRYKSNFSPVFCIVFALCLNRIMNLCLSVGQLIVKYMINFIRRVK